jgi:hypothetical protein
VPRSSIIVSDEPLSAETNYRTEFVAVLSNQPQGGFITRQPSAAVAMRDDGYWGGGDMGSFFPPPPREAQQVGPRPRGRVYYQPYYQPPPYYQPRGFW